MIHGARETPVAKYYSYARIEQEMQHGFCMSVRFPLTVKQRLSKHLPMNRQQLSTSIAMQRTCFLHGPTRRYITRNPVQLETNADRNSGSRQTTVIARNELHSTNKTNEVGVILILYMSCSWVIFVICNWARFLVPAFKSVLKKLTVQTANSETLRVSCGYSINTEEWSAVIIRSHEQWALSESTIQYTSGVWLLTQVRHVANKRPYMSITAEVIAFINVILQHIIVFSGELGRILCISTTCDAG
jgi:hypothetical protein